MRSLISRFVKRNPSSLPYSIETDVLLALFTLCGFVLGFGAAVLVLPR